MAGAMHLVFIGWSLGWARVTTFSKAMLSWGMGEVSAEGPFYEYLERVCVCVCWNPHREYLGMGPKPQHSFMLQTLLIYLAQGSRYLRVLGTPVAGL